MKKQIIIHSDVATHKWLKDRAKKARRTIGAEVLAIIDEQRAEIAANSGNRA
jgi:hypothetical protein